MQDVSTRRSLSTAEYKVNPCTLQLTKAYWSKVLHHILNYCYVCCSRTILLFLWCVGLHLLDSVLISESHAVAGFIFA